MKFEYAEHEYDEVEDSYEIRASRERYEKESAMLLKYINERDEIIKLLKIARPEKIADVRETIAAFDKRIEAQEQVVELIFALYRAQMDLRRNDMESLAMCEAILPELKKHLGETCPEELEILEAMLEGEKPH